MRRNGRKKGREMSELYAAYRGDELVAIGTVEELAEILGVKPRTVRWYATPTGKKRAERSKRARLVVEKLAGEEDLC